MTTKKPLFIQSRNWCFTDFESLNYEAIYRTYGDIIRYIGFGLEICPTTKKSHYQGWIQFVNPKRLNGVKKIFGTKKIHIEPCRGSEKQNTTYCSKESKYIYFGTFKTQGQRTDMENIKKLLDDGRDLKTVANDHFGDYIRYHSGLAKYKQMVDKSKTKKFREIKVTLITGATGTNKTRDAVEKNPNAFKITGKQLNWFDGYDMEPTLIIDEYNNDVGITALLNLLDGYQLRLPIKGAFTYANWTKVIITTNLKESEIHPLAKKEHRNALKRRITTVDNRWKTDEKNDEKSWCYLYPQV